MAFAEIESASLDLAPYWAGLAHPPRPCALFHVELVDARTSRNLMGKSEASFASAGSLRWWKTPPAVSALDAPPRDEGARERCIREVDRDCFVQHPRIPEGVIAHPSEV
jgi:hypothetical protein